MKPVGVQLATAIRPPGRATRTSSDAARAWSAVNITPMAETTTSNDASGKGRSSASPTTKSTSSTSAVARRRAMSTQLGHVVDARGARTAARGSEGGVTGAGGHVEDPLARPDVGPGDQRLGDRDRDGGDAVVVAAAPDPLLGGLELLQRSGDGSGGGDCGHGCPAFLGWVKRTSTEWRRVEGVVSDGWAASAG